MKKNFKEKLISGWKAFIDDPILYVLIFIILAMTYGGILFIAAAMFGFCEEPKDDVFGIYIGVWCGAIFLLVTYIYLDNHYREWKEAKKKTAAEPPNASEYRLPQHLEKLPSSKDQNDQVMTAKGKKEKSLYQRLKEMPYSNDRVGQSIIIVRGRHVVKPKNGDGGGGKNDN